MQGVLDWLAALPTAALYVMMGVAAALENIFPPLPADTVVAFGAFLAAQGEGTMVGSFLATLIGNMTGASIMYAAGRRYGAERLERRLLKDKGAAARERLRAMYEKYGMFALFLSRFVPGVRAIVPPFAGALRLPFVPALVAMTLASGLWYGFVAWLAFRVGSDWDRLQATIRQYGTILALVVAGIAAIGVIAWLVKRRR